MKFKYGTVSGAISELRKSGFHTDFRIKNNQIEYNNEKMEAGDLKIEVVYRYEGDSDPGDEASVYGIKSKSGLKGILVTGDGIYSDEASAQVLKKLHLAKNRASMKKLAPEQYTTD